MPGEGGGAECVCEGERERVGEGGAINPGWRPSDIGMCWAGWDPGGGLRNQRNGRQLTAEGRRRRAISDFRPPVSVSRTSPVDRVDIGHFLLWPFRKRRRHIKVTKWLCALSQGLSP
jgi:hypothetical protein